MSAPVKDRQKTAQKSAQRTAIPAQRQRPGRERSAPVRTERGTAATRAYARRDSRLQRDDRLRRLVGAGLGAARRSRPAAGTGRTPFVLLVMGLLGVGLVATLWLSTAAAADSFRLTDARAAATALQEQSEQLHRDVATMEAAPAIVARAQALGMVPVQDPPRIVVAADGSTSVVGTPHAVVPPAPVVRPTPNPAAPVVPPADAETQAGTGADDVTTPSTDPATGVTAGQTPTAAQATASATPTSTPAAPATAAPTAAAPTTAAPTTAAPTKAAHSTPSGTGTG